MEPIIYYDIQVYSFQRIISSIPSLTAVIVINNGRSLIKNYRPCIVVFIWVYIIIVNIATPSIIKISYPRKNDGLTIINY